MCLQPVEWVRGQSWVKASRNVHQLCLLSTKPLSLSQSLCKEADQRVKHAQRIHHIREFLSGWTQTSHYVSQRGMLRDVTAHTLVCLLVSNCENTCECDEQIHFSPECWIRYTFENTSVWMRRVNDDEFLKHLSVLNGLQLWSVMRKVGSECAALPVISDEIQRIKAFFLSS